MADILRLFADMITTWWEFMWGTLIPGTDFSFGGLYAFLIFLSLFLFIVRIAGHHEDKEAKK